MPARTFGSSDYGAYLTILYTWYSVAGIKYVRIHYMQFFLLVSFYFASRSPRGYGARWAIRSSVASQKANPKPITEGLLPRFHVKRRE